MLIIIRIVVICLLGFAYADSAIADESLPVPPSKISIAQIETTFAVDSTSPEVDPEYVKGLALTYFADIPEMIAICECESHFMHFRSDGTLNVSRHRNARGRRDSSATGACQVLYKSNYDKWAPNPEMNITTVLGNFAAARMMYYESGTNPWNESRGCWGSKINKYKNSHVADATS